MMAAFNSLLQLTFPTFFVCPHFSSFCSLTPFTTISQKMLLPGSLIIPKLKVKMFNYLTSLQQMSWLISNLLDSLDSMAFLS